MTLNFDEHPTQFFKTLTEKFKTLHDYKNHIYRAKHKNVNISEIALFKPAYQGRPRIFTKATRITKPKTIDWKTGNSFKVD